MAWNDFWRTASKVQPAPRADVTDGGVTVMSLNDPLLQEILRGGFTSASGANVSMDSALRNTAMFRAVSLIAYAIGMLPLQLIDEGTKQKATGHSLYRVLHRHPNNWQTAFDFRSHMQLYALCKGNAYARIIRSPNLRTGKTRVIRLVPMNQGTVTPRQSDTDWSVSYVYQPKNGPQQVLAASDVFHLRGLSKDGLTGLALVQMAADAIGLALSAQLAAGRLFKNGAIGGVVLEHPSKLSDPAFERLKGSIAEKEGPENAGKAWVLEEGMKLTIAASSSAKDAQLVEVRKMQTEEIARVMGVPRPLLMIDETSWGSGIEALGRFFVQYALGPWFTAWEQAVERSLLDDDEQDLFAAKFNAGALLRGSTKDQADFFAKALGAGGAPGWMTPNEVRDLSDLPAVPDGNEISKGAMGHNGGPPLDNEDIQNVAA